MTPIAILVLVNLGYCIGQQVVGNGNPLEKERKIKGQQYVSQTVVAKVVGPSGFSSDFLENLKDGDKPIVIDNATLVEGPNGTAALVTENVKTTVTRITIPLSTNFMDSDWYRNTLKKFLQKNRVALTNNSIETEYSTNDKVDIDLIMLKLWAGATLRDNLITVFGTLLFNSKQSLHKDLHSALTHLYELARLRRMSTVGFLPTLEQMSFETPHEQFKILFQKMEKYIPKYIRSCVTYWLESLYTNKVNMTQLLTNENGVLVADFLSGIESSVLIPLKQKVLFPKDTVMNTLPENEELLGKMVSQVYTAILENTISLTPQLFAGILLHLPLNSYIPEADEYQRYFVDLVKMGNETYEEFFKKAVNGISLKRYSDPYELTKAVFKSLISMNLDSRELYETILIHIQKSSNTYSLRNQDVIAPIINSKNINLDVLLRSIVPEEYPLDIVDAKDRLLYYIDRNYIDYDYVLRGFVKYQENTPNELLIAILTRLEVRSRNLSPELLLTLRSLKSHIIYKQALNNLRLNLSVMDLSTLLFSFQSPNLPITLRNTAAELRVLLPAEFTDMNYQLNKQSTEQCNRPRQCVVSILKYLSEKKQIQNKTCQTKVNDLLAMVNENGEPIMGQRSLTGSQGWVCMPQTSARRTQMSFRAEQYNFLGESKNGNLSEIYPGKYNPSPYKGTNFNLTMYEMPIYVSRLDSGRIRITGQNGEVFFTSEGPVLNDLNFTRVPVPHPGWINNNVDDQRVLPTMKPDEESSMALLRKLLNSDNLYEKLNLDPKNYGTRGALLVDIMNKSLENSSIFESHEQRNFVLAYLKLLKFIYSVLPPPPPKTSKNLRQEVNLRTLLLAVPPPVDEESEQKFKILKAYLSNPNLSSLNFDIDTSVYPSKGSYLKRLFQLLSENDGFKDENLVNAIRYFDDSIMTSGYGAQPVDLVLVMEKGSGFS